jgi:transposase
MPKVHIVRLSEEERAFLRTFVGKGQAHARALTHARILLKADQSEGGPGWKDTLIATALEVHPTTVADIRKEYVTTGLQAALTRKAPDRHYQRKLDGEQEAQLIALTCSAPPEGRQRWTLRLLADHLVRLEVVDTISHEAVRQTLKQTTSSRG